MAASTSQLQPPLPSPSHLQFRPQEPPPSQQQQQQQQQQQTSSQSQPRSPLKQQLFQTAQPTKTKAKTRTFSFRSDKSRGSISKNKIDLRETHAEKDARRLHSKADPSVAMNEAEPAVVAAMVATSIAPLRAIQHRDAFGNVIADPDKSNPTRNRWERPLDTIRSFEAAIEGDYARRSMYRSDMDQGPNYSRRNSYQRPNPPRFPQDNYYGNRTTSFRDESPYGMASGAARNSYYETQSYNGACYTSQNGYGDPGNQSTAQGRYPSHPSRTSPEHHHSPQGYGRDQQNVYPLPHKDRSYETVTSAAASGSSEAAGYQTDPTSSDNSSIHRQSPIKSVHDNAIRLHQSQSHRSTNRSPNYGTSSKNPFPNPPAPSYQSNPQSAIPRQQISIVKRQPLQEQHQQQHQHEYQQQQQQQQVHRQPQPQMQPQSATPEKRKSWLVRRFSKKS